MTIKELEKFYEDCMRTGRMPKDGLCKCIDETDIDIFKPSHEEIEQLAEDGMSYIFWGSGLSFYSHLGYLMFAFTPLRQTIVLFLIEIKKHPIK